MLPFKFVDPTEIMELGTKSLLQIVLFDMSIDLVLSCPYKDAVYTTKAFAASKGYAIESTADDSQTRGLE